MSRLKEGLQTLLDDLATARVLDIDAETLDGYFGDRQLTEKQYEAFMSELNNAGYSVQAIYRIYRDVSGYRAFFEPERPEVIDLNAETLRALSIRQPHVERILRGDKNIEYRSWPVKQMGLLILHASNTREPPELFADVGIADADALPYGALVGVIDVVDCVYDSQNEVYEWLLAYPRRFAKAIPFKGAASIFKVPLNDAVVKQIKNAD